MTDCHDEAALTRQLEAIEEHATHETTARTPLDVPWNDYYGQGETDDEAALTRQLEAIEEARTWYALRKSALIAERDCPEEHRRIDARRFWESEVTRIEALDTPGFDAKAFARRHGWTEEQLELVDAMRRRRQADLKKAKARVVTEGGPTLVEKIAALEEPPAVEEMAAVEKQPPRPGPDPDDTVTAEEVKTERQQRKDRGEPFGDRMLAKHFQCSETTIRRRRGTLK